MTPETPESILAFWFGDERDDARCAECQAPLWWQKNPETDRHVAERFGDAVRRAMDGELDAWAQSARGRLALIVLLDQLPRMLHRDSARAFDCDERALHCCLDGLADGLDRELRPVERLFFYLPLEHSEDLEHQQRCLDLCLALCREVPPTHRATFEQFLRFAERHRDVVARFGRFPHRNAALGRASTPEELAYLGEPGAGF